MLIDTLSAQIKTMFLDMNGTFLFNHDRFGRDQDFYAAYSACGGSRTNSAALNLAVRQVLQSLETRYVSSREQQRLPPVFDVAREALGSDYDDADCALIEQTICVHELGTLSTAHAQAMKALSERFRLFVVSNLWSQSAPWKTYLTEQLGTGVFSGWVFSSDHGINKPDLGLFRRALALAAVEPEDVVMVGDDLERDMEPAKALGMTTIWLSTPRDNAPTAANRCVDHRINELTQLLEPGD